MVKCCRSYMRCARLPGGYAIERYTLRRSLNGLELHLHVPNNMIINTASTVSCHLTLRNEKSSVQALLDPVPPQEGFLAWHSLLEL